MRHRAANLLRTLAPVLCLPLTTLAAPPACAETPTDEWHFNLGAAITRVSEYAGSAAHKTRLVPILSANHGRFFIGPVPAGGPLGNGTRMSLGRLQGDAAASPLTEQRSQNSGALFASYRFWRLPKPAKEPLMIQRRAVFLGISRSGKNTPTVALTNALLRVTALALGTLTRPKARTSLRCV